MDKQTKTVALIVAHPDDETLWAGGTILTHPQWNCFIACLCRKNDPGRAPKFAKALKKLNAGGAMGNLDDEAEQMPLNETEVQEAMLQLLPSKRFDLVITHSIYGEYTRHRRHEEIGRAVINLWSAGKISMDELWAFAYDDGNRAYKPAALDGAPVIFALPYNIWEEKYNIITNIYGFGNNTWEAQTTPKKEAFWQFYQADEAFKWLTGGNITS